MQFYNELERASMYIHVGKYAHTSILKLRPNLCLTSGCRPSSISAKVSIRAVVSCPIECVKQKQHNTQSWSFNLHDCTYYQGSPYTLAKLLQYPSLWLLDPGLISQSSSLFPIIMTGF